MTYGREYAFALNLLHGSISSNKKVDISPENRCNGGSIKDSQSPCLDSVFALIFH